MIRTGPYIDLPAGEAFRGMQSRTRSLTGLLSDLGKHAERTILVAVPFVTAPVLDDWLATWTRDNVDLQITIVHRQVPATNLEAERLSEVMQRWSRNAPVYFRTYPGRDPGSRAIRGPTFHSKLIEVDRSHLIVMSANLNEHSRSQNAEVAYVFGPREAIDLRRFVRRLEQASLPDPLAGPVGAATES